MASRGRPRNYELMARVLEYLLGNRLTPSEVARLVGVTVRRVQQIVGALVQGNYLVIEYPPVLQLHPMPRMRTYTPGPRAPELISHLRPSKERINFTPLNDSPTTPSMGGGVNTPPSDPQPPLPPAVTLPPDLPDPPYRLHGGLYRARLAPLASTHPLQGDRPAAPGWKAPYRLGAGRGAWVHRRPFLEGVAKVTVSRADGAATFTLDMRAVYEDRLDLADQREAERADILLQMAQREAGFEVTTPLLVVKPPFSAFGPTQAVRREVAAALMHGATLPLIPDKDAIVDGSLGSLEVEVRNAVIALAMRDTGRVIQPRVDALQRRLSDLQRAMRDVPPLRLQLDQVQTLVLQQMKLLETLTTNQTQLATALRNLTAAIAGNPTEDPNQPPPPPDDKAGYT